jgi:hypothetical protein
MIADIVAVGILYREYYGRSIVAEAFNDPDKWEWDEEEHKYHRSDLNEKEEHENCLIYCRLSNSRSYTQSKTLVD